jgi:acyl-CoA reductase-like NAD-dependent aldehyde dehydrogenase
MSMERVIVQREISNSLISAVISLCEPLKAGDPSKNPMGPLFSQGSAINILGMVQEALDAGAELLLVISTDQGQPFSHIYYMARNLG